MKLANDTELDTSCAYRIHGYEGIAWKVLGYDEYEDADFYWTGYTTEDRDKVRAHMIGDDREFTFDIDDIEKLPDDAYCSGCGQIGCGWC